MSFQVVIPARLGSTRLPRKPLLRLAGVPLVVWVWRAAQQCAAKEVWVATDSEEVASVVEAVGGKVVRTSADHPSGTDRLAEVAEQLGWAEDEVVVNWQGDEPLLPPSVVERVAAQLAIDSDAAVATAAVPVRSVQEWQDPSVVKVVVNARGWAAYFSRAPIPWGRDYFLGAGRESASAPPFPVWRHLGVYAYRVGFLHRFAKWGEVPWERAERLEQLRALYYGERVAVVCVSEAPPAGVDTQEDLERVESILIGLRKGGARAVDFVGPARGG
ncbi:MAG: 3-deoxy-manno-octulosonate cytidylyltransferase [Hydrogenophilus sp.]|nr:3-deoxy-manno-octulosonate cytidylyltransferase [Hydrogenophilus sp.]